MQKFMSRNLEVAFDRKNGAIASIRHRGEELVFPAPEAFTLQLLDRSGNSFLLKSSEFRYDGERYSGHPEFPSIRVMPNVRSDADFIRFRPSVCGIPDAYVLEWIDLPQIVFRNGNTLFQPLHDGLEITDPRRKPHPYHPIAFAKRGVYYGSFFPGRSQMQFMAVYNQRGGFYFAAHDPECGVKAVEYEPLESGTRLSLQTFTGCSYGHDYDSSFDYVIGGFDGNWMAACSIYRKWFESYAPVAAASEPEWMRRSPVVLIYPVRGHGRDVGEMEENCYFPYDRMASLADCFNEVLQSPVMPLLMHWEGTAPWAPPYVWPPYGGCEALAALRDALHAKGNLLGVYCSGTAWTQKSCITAYSREDQFRREGLERYMLRGPKGEIEATVCNGPDAQRLGYELCLTEPWSRDTIKNEILKIAEFGIDYAQFFDQNHGGSTHVCYSHSHRHPPVPGPWQTEAVRSLMREILSEIKRKNSKMILGCESAAAEPYLDFLPLNDARASFLYGTGRPVPAQSFVFHERTRCFAGNQCGISHHFDLEASPWNLFYRIAYAFHAGDLLSIPLKEEGRPHWCWGLPWSVPGPEAETVFTLIRNLNALRRNYPEFLLHGRMMMPMHRVEGGRLSLCLKNNRTLPVDSFFHSTWQSRAGKQVQIVTNFLPEEQKVRVDGGEMVLPPLDALVLE